MTQQSILLLPDDWEEFQVKCTAVGLDPFLTLSAKYGRIYGAYTDECEYVPDVATWAYYQSLKASS